MTPARYSFLLLLLAAACVSHDEAVPDSARAAAPGPRGHYLIVSAPPDTTHPIIFETDGRTVVNYRAGARPAVELVEGCA